MEKIRKIFRNENVITFWEKHIEITCISYIIEEMRKIKRKIWSYHGIFKLRIFISVFADFYDLLFPGSPEDEESGSLPGEPGLLCLGRAHLYFPHAFFYHIRLCVGKADRRIQREGSLQDLFAMFHCHQSFYPGIF